MANITYATALTSIRDFAIEHDFDNEEVIKKVNDLIKQKTKKGTNKKSNARKANEEVVEKVVTLMHDEGLTEVDNKWLRENFDEILSPARATAVFNVGVNMGLFEPVTHQKSATRNVLTYVLVA